MHTATTDQMEPGILPDVYPSDNINAMLDEAERLEPSLYTQRYCVYSDFPELGQLTVMVEYCKQTIPELLRTKAFDAEGPRLKEFAAQAGVGDHVVFLFHREMVKRMIGKQHAFIGYTHDNAQFNLYDLAEDVTRCRYITVAECGACKRLATQELPLEECKFCHSAAYCNNRCRKRDLKFHQKHCQALKRDYEQRKGRIQVLAKQQQARQETTDQMINAGIQPQQQPRTEERVEEMNEEGID